MSTSPDELLVRAAIIDELTGPLRVVEAELDKVTAAAARLKAESGPAGATGGLRALAGANGELGKIAKSAHGTLLDMSNTLGGALYSNAKRAVEGVGALAAGLAYMGVKATATFESARLGVETFAGSVTKGDALFGQLRGFVGPFDISSLTDAAQSLLVASDGADHLIPRMKALTDIAATQADPKGALSTLADSLNRIQESGNVDARTIRPLLNAGVPVYELLAGELGTTPDQVKKTLSSGAPIDLPLRFLTDIETEAGPLARFQGAAQKQRSTLKGQFEGIHLDAQQALADVFAPLGDSLKQITPIISSGLTNLIRGVGPDLIKFISSLAALAGGILPILQPIAGAVLGAIAQVLTALLPALNQLAPQAPQLAQAFADLIIALIPAIPPLTTLTVALVPVLVLGIKDITYALTELIQWLTPVVDWLARTIDKSSALRDVLGYVLVGILAYSAITKVVGIIMGVVDAVTALTTALWGLDAAEAAGGAGGIAGLAGGAAGAGEAATAAAAAETAGAGAAAGGAGAAGAGAAGLAGVAGLGAIIGSGIVIAGGAIAIDQWSKAHPAEAKQYRDLQTSRDAAARASADQWTKTGMAPVPYTGGPVTYQPSAADNAGTGGAVDTSPLTPQERAELDPANAQIVVNGPLVHVDQANATPDHVAGAVRTAVDDLIREGRQR